MAAGCSTRAPTHPKPPEPIETTATLAITPGIRILSEVAMPPGFVPMAGQPPMWLQNGSEIGVVGTKQNHIEVLGFSGPGWRSSRVLAAETGSHAAEQGAIVDAAASPNGLTLATAVVPTGAARLDIVLRDLIATGAGHVVTRFHGRYDSVSMSWLNDSTVAIALRAHPEPATTAADETGAPVHGQSLSSLQILVVSGAGSAIPLRLGDCPMSTLSWSRHGVYAIGEGDAAAPPVVIDRANSSCRRLGFGGPIHVLGWSPRDEGEFLYLQRLPRENSAGVFRYNITTEKGRLIAAASAAAAWTARAAVIALGDQRLSGKVLALQPSKPVLAQIAIFDPVLSRIDLKSLGFTTPPQMLVHSTMTYSLASNRAAIQTYAPVSATAMRKLVIYSVRQDNAFLIAFGPARGIAELSWSPRGRWLAIVDGDANGSTLSVILPPG
jgi:hypothetical protein